MNHSLFKENKNSERPLAEQCRPQQFCDLVGQTKLLAEDSPFRSLIASEKFHSLIFWGPSGCGKTSLAYIIGQTLNRPMISLSAVNCGAKEIRQNIFDSEADGACGKKAWILFIDEIHRLNKAQQDILLPALETGTIKLIGATTENPSFEVIGAILSRSLVFKLEKLDRPSILKVIKKGLENNHNKINLSQNLINALADISGGDARKALNLVDSLLAAFPQATDLTIENLEQLGVDVRVVHDKHGDSHFDLASALIKSIRASHPDAAVYYLARLLEGGEDPLFIARRLMIAASEDIGNANPHAISIAASAAQAVHWVGMPEARIILAQVCTFLASSPKSNASYVAIDKAIADVRAKPYLEVPLHLRNAPTNLMKQHGYGKGYIYPHDEEEKSRHIPYLPHELKGTVYYSPTANGYEAKISENIKLLKPFD